MKYTKYFTVSILLLCIPLIADEDANAEQHLCVAKGYRICHYTVFGEMVISYQGSCFERSMRCSSSVLSFPQTLTPFS